mmetsp:Transcript_87305/g.154736  ORF Transcript_87305/g.154736 Transcript_87305/m.154736 type:complete len:380 (-) Transcript_87305:741-1880(-)
MRPVLCEGLVQRSHEAHIALSLARLEDVDTDKHGRHLGQRTQKGVPQLVVLAMRIFGNHVPERSTELGVHLQDNPTQNCSNGLPLSDGLTLDYLGDAWDFQAGNLLEELVDLPRILLWRQEQNKLRRRREIRSDNVLDVFYLLRANHSFRLVHFHAEGHASNVTQRSEPNVQDRLVMNRIHKEPVGHSHRALQAISQKAVEASFLDEEAFFRAEADLKRLQHMRIDLHGRFLQLAIPLLKTLRSCTRAAGLSVRIIFDHVLSEVCNGIQALLRRDLRLLHGFLMEVLVLSDFIVDACESTELRQQEDFFTVLLSIGFKKRLLSITDCLVVEGLIVLCVGDVYRLLLIPLVQLERAGRGLVKVDLFDPVNSVVVGGDYSG